MKYNGKIPMAVVGEIQHVVNNALGPIMLRASAIGGEDGEKIEQAVMRIAEYIKSLGEREQWNSNPFELASESQACAMYNRNDDGEAA